MKTNELSSQADSVKVRLSLAGKNVADSQLGVQLEGAQKHKSTHINNPAVCLKVRHLHFQF